MSEKKPQSSEPTFSEQLFSQSVYGLYKQTKDARYLVAAVCQGLMILCIAYCIAGVMFPNTLFEPITSNIIIRQLFFSAILLAVMFYQLRLYKALLQTLGILVLLYFLWGAV